MITGSILKQLAPSIPSDKANTIAALLDKICPTYGINTPDIFHEFISNLLEETGEFKTLEEGLNYQSIALQKLFSRQRIGMGQTIDFGRTMTHPANQQMIANTIYGGQWGLINLGNRQQGDGWMFRGSGPMQLTGRALISKFAAYYNARYGTSFTPEAMADELRHNLEVGVHSACWVFAIVFKLIDEAINDDFKAIVKKINGGYLNMDKRQMYYERAKVLIV